VSATEYKTLTVDVSGSASYPSTFYGADSYGIAREILSISGVTLVELARMTVGLARLHKVYRVAISAAGLGGAVADLVVNFADDEFEVVSYR
jgi:hypothetical protein